MCDRTRITRIARILHDAAPVRASGMIAFSLTQTTQKTQTIRTLQYNQRDLDKNSQNTHTQACAGHPDGTRERSDVGLAKGIVLLWRTKVLAVATDAFIPRRSVISVVSV